MNINKWKLNSYEKRNSTVEQGMKSERNLKKKKKKEKRKRKKMEK